MMLNDPPNDSNLAVNSTTNHNNTIAIAKMPSTQKNRLSSNIENEASSNNNKQQQKLPHHFLLTKVVARIPQVASVERYIESFIVNGLIDYY